MKKGLQLVFLNRCNPLILLVRPEGFGPPTYGFEDQKSEGKKTQHFQRVDSLVFFNGIFGFIWFNL